MKGILHNAKSLPKIVLGMYILVGYDPIEG